MASSLWPLNRVIQFLGDKLVVQEAVVGGSSAKISVWDFRAETKVDLKPVRQVLEKPDTDELLLEVKPLQVINFSAEEMDFNVNKTEASKTRSFATFYDYFKLD